MRAAFVAALPGYLTSLVAAAGADPDRCGERLEAAVGDLEAAFEGFAVPFADQRIAPMEVVRDVVARFVARCVEDGVVAAGAVPAGEPASSAVLGEEAWQAHLRWGMAKADAVAPRAAPDPGPLRPVAVVVAEPDVRGVVVAALEGCGYAPRVVRNRAGLAGLDARPRLGVVDDRHTAVSDLVRGLVDAGAFVVVFGAGITDLRSAALRAAGAHRVVERDRFVADPCRHVAAVV